MSMPFLLELLAKLGITATVIIFALSFRKKSRSRYSRVRYAGCPCSYCSPRAGWDTRVTLGVFAADADGRRGEVIHKAGSDGITSLPALTGVKPAATAGNYLRYPGSPRYARTSYQPIVPVPFRAVMPTDFIRPASKGDPSLMPFMSRPKCPAAAGNGCTCKNGGCTSQCTCAWCLSQAWATPPPSRSSASRAGHAGVAGFDGKSRGEFEFEIGSVYGLRQWDFPVSALLHKVINDEVPPAMGLLVPAASDPPLLKGQTGRQLWEPGIMEARCNNHREHRPPVEWDPVRGQECGCGFWAYWKLGTHTWNASLPVHGVVEGTGRVLIGEKGFRSQRARIVALTPGFLVDPVYHGSSSGAPEKEMAEKRSKADAWNAVLMEELGALYPDARVFATMRAMLAIFPPGER